MRKNCMQQISKKKKFHESLKDNCVCLGWVIVANQCFESTNVENRCESHVVHRRWVWVRRDPKHSCNKFTILISLHMKEKNL